MLNRRTLFRSLWAVPSLPGAMAQEVDRRNAGLAPLTIKDAKVITTSAGGGYRWIFLKVITSEPGLYGIGSANNHYQTQAVVTALEKHLIPFLVGQDASRIEDLWQTAHLRTYWRNGIVNNNVLSAMDMALWDIKGKRAGMPVYELLGGKARDAVPCYDHAGGKDKESAAESVLKSVEAGYRHVRVQFGPYGGGGFIPKGQGQRPEGGYDGVAFDEEQYVENVPRWIDYVRNKVGPQPKLLHDVHSHLSGSNAVEFCRRVQPYQLFFVEDVLAPEQIEWYRHIRQVCTTPQAVGEVFSHPFEWLPLVTNRWIDFVRCRVAATGGITPAKKMATICEPFGVRTAFQEGGENDPVNQLAAYHVDISSAAFGIQEENHFPPLVHELMPGTAQIRRGYLYGSGKPGLGIDIDEKMAARYPLGDIPRGGAWPLERTLDGAIVKP